MRRGDFEGAHRALDGWAAEHADDPVMTTHGLRFRAIVLHRQFGPIAEVGQLLKDVWRACKSLGPGDQAIAINDIIVYAHSVGDIELGNHGRIEYASLLERYGEDPVVQSHKSRLCLGLGWLAHVQHDLSTATAWFINADLACDGDGEDSRETKTIARSLAALECTRLTSRSEAIVHLGEAKKTLIPHTVSAAYYCWVHAETSLAMGRIFEAEDWIEEAARVPVFPDLKILVPCTRARIEDVLGHTKERDSYIAQAEAQVTPHTALYLRQEIQAARPKPA